MSELEDPNEGVPSELEFLRINFLALQRIYDVLLALLFDANEEVAADLMQRHARFEYLGTFPFMEKEVDDG